MSQPAFKYDQKQNNQENQNSSFSHPNLLFVVEDDIDLQNILTYNLERRGFKVRCFSKAESALEALESHNDVKPDAFLVDINLAGHLNGVEFTRMLRARKDSKYSPVIMLTAKGEAQDVINGLNEGADDYLSKPFDIDVLSARIKSVQRRSKTSKSPVMVEKKKLALCGIEVDPVSREVLVEGNSITLTFTEFGLLATMMEKPNQVFERDDLVLRVMGPGKAVTSRTIDVHIRALRSKLTSKAKHVGTVRGVGYKFVENA